MTQYFHCYQPPKPAKELLAEFWKLEKEAEKILDHIIFNRIGLCNEL